LAKGKLVVKTRERYKPYRADRNLKMQQIAMPNLKKKETKQHPTGRGKRCPNFEKGMSHRTSRQGGIGGGFGWASIFSERKGDLVWKEIKCHAGSGEHGNTSGREGLVSRQSKALLTMPPKMGKGP